MDYFEAPKAWGLVRGMARALGLNLVEAVMEGWLSRKELADLVETCLNCDRSERCTAWLGQHVRAESLPDFCPNKARIEALRP